MECIEKICSLCNNHMALYTCPKCGIKYCSVVCYQREDHIACSEAFYKDEVIKSLNGMRIDDEEDKKKVIDMLKKVDENNDLNPASSQAIEIDDLELNNIWNKLDEVDKKEFLDAVKNDSLGVFLKPWTPWWKNEHSNRIIDEKDNKRNDIPKIWKPSHFNVKKTKNNFICDILNILFTYVYVIHRHNGDVFDLLFDSAEEILSLSSTLTGNNFKDISTAIVEVIYNINTRPDKNLYISDEYTISILEELCHIIEGGIFLNSNEFILAALSECRAIFKCCNKLIKSEPKNKLYFLAQKKIEFFISWIFELSPDFRDVVSLIWFEVNGRKKQLFDKDMIDKSGIKVKLPPSVNIEEI